MGPLLTHPALRFGDERHDVADLVLVGLFTGEWQRHEQLVRRGLALEHRRPERPRAEEREQALAAFRYERRLIAAAELEAWLAERALGLADVDGVLCRAWLREQFPEGDGEPAAAACLAAVMRAETLCAGTLARCADVLRAWHAGSRSDAVPAADPARVDDIATAALGAAAGLAALGAAEVRRRVVRLAALEAGYARFCAAAVSSGAIDARVAERRLEWTVVTGSELSFEHEGAARETRLRVLHDGEALAQVAGMLGVEPVWRAVELGGAPAGLGAELLAAREGDLVGPWSESARWRVLEIDGHFHPEDAPGDGARARARAELLSELVERLAAGKGGILAAL
jgi:hypothetical protein